MSSAKAKKSRIIMSCDSSSSSSSVAVYSVQDDSSSGSSSNSDDSMLDFEKMWDKEMAKRPSQEGMALATQPPEPTKKKPAGTPVPKRILTNKNATVETPDSLKLSQPSMDDGDKKPAAKKPAPKVSLSPPNKVETNVNDTVSSKLQPGSRVTMLEAVVTSAATTNWNNKKSEAGVVEAVGADKKQSMDKNQSSNSTKPPSDRTTDVVKAKKGKKETVPTEKIKSNKNPSSTKPVKMTEDKPKSKKRKSSTDDGKGTGKSKGEKKSTSGKHKKDSTQAKESSSKKAKVDKSAPSKPIKSVSSDKKRAAAKSSEASQTQPAAAKRKSPSNDSNMSTSQPPKKKTKKRTFQQELMFQMLMSCKPYTLKSLANSLNSTEAAIHHVMLSLVDKRIVIKKEFTTKNGRTKELYWANQDSTAKQVTSLELPSVETIKSTREDYASYKAKDSFLTRELALVQQELSNEDLDKKLAELQEAVNTAQTQVKDTKERIAVASKQQGGKPNNSRTLKKRINHMRDEWKRRKTKTMDFVDILADGMEKPPKAVVKLLELETDEMEGVTMPPKHDV